MKNSYTTLFIALFIFSTTHIKASPLERLSSERVLEVLESGQLINHFAFNQSVHQANNSDLAYIPPYTCPACIISITACPINCVKLTCENYVAPTCLMTFDIMCLFMVGRTCHEHSSHPHLSPAADSCCDKFDKKICPCTNKECIDSNCQKFNNFCDYTFCCRWLEQRADRNEE